MNDGFGEQNRASGSADPVMSKGDLEPVPISSIGEGDNSGTPVLDSSLDWGRFFDDIDEMDEVSADVPGDRTALVPSTTAVSPRQPAAVPSALLSLSADKKLPSVDEQWMGTVIENLVSSFTQTAISSCANKGLAAARVSHSQVQATKTSNEGLSSTQLVRVKEEKPDSQYAEERNSTEQPHIPAQNVALISSMLQHLARAVPQEFYRMQSQQQAQLNMLPHSDFKSHQVGEAMA
jgi:hypothetical protein